MFAIIDLETTGGVAHKDKIIEIGIVFHNGKEITGKWETLINPTVPISAIITSITGIDNRMVANAPKFYEIAKDLVEMLKGNIFVAHNARFDYGFVKNEFADLGYSFNSETLCTVKMSREFLKGHKSYSLGKLCAALGIKINGRHRAMGDAYATALVMQKVIDENGKDILSNYFETEKKRGHYPSSLDASKIDSLPTKHGVYFFHNSDGEIIYIGKSINIRKRVQDHLMIDLKSTKGQKMKAEIADITFTLTGTELISLLLESSEVKSKRPKYNVALTTSKHSYGLYSYQDEDGYINFSIEKVANMGDGVPLALYGSLAGGKGAVGALADQHGLCLSKLGLHKYNSACFNFQLRRCKGACVGKESISDYNLKANVIADKFLIPDGNILIYGDGRSATETSIVAISNRKLLGFSYIDKTSQEPIEDIISYGLQHGGQNKDTIQILRAFFKSRYQEKVSTWQL